MKKRNRLTLDLKPNQLQVLTELKDILNTNYSMLLRAIILDFLTRNEEALERIIDKNSIENANKNEEEFRIFE